MPSSAIEIHEKKLLNDPEYAKTWSEFTAVFWDAMREGIIAEQKSFTMEEKFGTTKK